MSQQSRIGNLLPTTYLFDVNQIYSTEVTSPAFKELLVRLYQTINSMTLALNVKDTGYYTLEQFLNGQLFFPNPAYNSTTTTLPTYRQVFRTVVNFGALPDTTIISKPHNIPDITSGGAANGFTFTRIYGCATKPNVVNPTVSYLPIPYSSITNINLNIELNADTTNVNITTASNYSAYTICYVVLEYITQ